MAAKKQQPTDVATPAAAAAAATAAAAPAKDVAVKASSAADDKKPAAAVAAAAAKSASKNKKKKPRNTDVTRYKELVDQHAWPITIQASQSKGRHAVAQKDLQPGDIVCQERAATLIVSTPASNDFCHRCVTSLHKAEQAQQRVTCGTCGKTTYCSSNCQKADAARHALECPIIPKLAEIATKNDINADLLRLTLSLIVRRGLEQKRDKLSDENKKIVDEEAAVYADAPIAPWWVVQELAVHTQVFEKKWIKSVTAAAKEMSDILPELLATSGEEIVRLSCRINTNAHSLTDDEEKVTDTAFGLFPMGALFFRHSCAPNCHFTADKGILTYRAMKPLRAGEELYVSHIELYQNRSVRRQELMTTKQIKCDCVRCRAPLRKSVDRYLEGVLCEKCHTGVYVNESEFPEFYPKKDANGKAEEDEKKKKEEEEKKEDDPEDKRTDEEKAAAKADDELRDTLLKTIVRCDNDKCNHENNLWYVERVRMQAQRDYQSIYQFSTSKNHPLVIQYFRMYIDSYKQLLHPYYVQLVNAHLPLLNSLKTKGEYAACLPLIKHLISVYENSNVVPHLRHEFVELYSELASILSALANMGKKSQAEALAAQQAAQQQAAGAANGGGAANGANNAAPPQPPKKKPHERQSGAAIFEKRYRKEALEAYRKAYEVAKTVLGEGNSKTVELKTKAKV